MEYEVLNDFELYSKVPEEVIAKYEGKIPEPFIDIWENYGFGTFLEGYFKIINPDDYIDFVEKAYFVKGAIPLLATALGDIIVWERGEYLYILFYRYNDFDCLESGCEFFFEDMCDENYRNKDFKIKNFKEAVKKFGKPAYDECFGYVPLLSLGGAETVKHMEKVNLPVHLELIYDMQGGI